MNKFNRKEIMILAMSNIKTKTSDPYEAIVMAFETWLIKKNYDLVPVLPKGDKAGDIREA